MKGQGLSFCLIFIFLFGGGCAQGQAGDVGIFEGHQDVGTVLHPGSTSFDAAKQSYTVTGSGENMWFGMDDFQFAWKKMSGDVTISADITFVGDKGNNHRKAVLMIRQSLDGNSPAVDIARHGDGLTSLQFRDSAGADDHEVQSNVIGPKRVRLEKRGDYFYAFVSGTDGKLEPAGASTKLVLNGPFYVGIGVSAHDKDATESAVFSNVRVETLAAATEKPVLYSTLETVPIASADRRVAYVAQKHFEAPNWSRDGSYFLFNQDGGIYRLAVNGAEPARIPTDPQVKCNNDHGISPDGSLLAISDSTETGKSMVYTLPIAGGTPKKITATGPSYWHGWSPDGTTLLCRTAGRQLRYLFNSGEWGRGEAADDGTRSGRRAGVLAGWTMDLLQLRTYRAHADLADAYGWRFSRTGDLRQDQQLVPAYFSRWEVDDFCRF